MRRKIGRGIDLEYTVNPNTQITKMENKIPDYSQEK